MAELNTELTHEELVVLAGALRVMMMADGRLSFEEMESASAIARQLGIDDLEWDAIWDESAETLPSEEAVKEAAIGVRRMAAREVVYELLYQLANSDSIDDAEWDLLEWLDETWLDNP